MTATAPSTPRPVRPRLLRDDLLDDLRQAAPMPTAPPKPDIPVPVASTPGRPAPQPAGRPAPVTPGTPTVELCVTPKLWWGFRMKTLGETPGVVIGAGPVQISLTGFRR
jgi:hypothetical protein